MKQIWNLYHSTRGTAGSYIHGLMTAFKLAGYDALAFASSKYCYSTPGVIKWFFPLTERFERKNRLLLVLRGIEFALNYFLIWIAASVRRPVIHMVMTDSSIPTYLFFKACRLSRLRVIVTCIDVIEHDGKMPPRRMEMFEHADMKIVHTVAAEKMLATIFGAEDGKTISYPYPNHDYASILDERILSMASEKIKKILIAGRKWFLFIGYIREDKGIEILRKAWNDSFKGTEAGLVIVGKWSENMDTLKRSFENDDNIIIIDGRFDKEYFTAFIKAAHFVLLPYEEYAHSGILYSCAYAGGAVILSDISLFTEMLPDYEFTFKQGNAEELGEIMLKALNASEGKKQQAVALLREAINRSLEKLPHKLKELKRELIG